MICTETDINLVETELGVRFPRTYRMFLLNPPADLEFEVDMANDPREHKVIREIANRVRDEHGLGPLAEVEFPFFAWQDDMYASFSLDGESDDPETTLVVAGVSQTVFPTFTAWLIEMSGDTDEPKENLDQKSESEVYNYRKLAKNCVQVWNCALAAGGHEINLPANDGDPISHILQRLGEGVRIETGPFAGETYTVASLADCDEKLVKKHLRWQIYSSDYGQLVYKR
jgi:hypothetical protein